MPFVSLLIHNFRNLQNTSIDLLSKEVYFVGENGQGKSNMLDAIYYSAYGSSFRTNKDTEIIKHGESSFNLRAIYKEPNGKTQMIHVSYQDGKKTIEKNEKKIHDRKELINTIPCVIFCHNDMRFIIGEPVHRRFLIDQSLSMNDILYIDTLRQYTKILKYRNAVLKEHNYELLDTYDKQLAEKGLIIQKKRKDIIFQFNQIFGQLYMEISGIEGISITYEPSWKEKESEIGKSFPALSDVINFLYKKRYIDEDAETTITGPHRDKINFRKNGKSFVSSASTGQQRLLALLLRIVQSIFYARNVGIKPIFLMDDVMLELDPKKRQKLMSLLPDYDQLFCTFLPEEPYNRYAHSETKIFFIENGYWHE